jgi:hypothetical protein
VLITLPGRPRRRPRGGPAGVNGAPGVIRAIEECLPRSLRQRCLAHKMRNLQSKVPEDVWPGFKARAAACYQAASPALARLLRDDIAGNLRKPAALGGGLSRRRFRGVHRAFALPARPSPGHPHYQSGRSPRARSWSWRRPRAADGWMHSIRFCSRQMLAPWDDNVHAAADNRDYRRPGDRLGRRRHLAGSELQIT